MKDALLRYLRAPREVIHAAHTPSADEGANAYIDFEVDVDLPQRPVYPVNQVERIRVRFPPNQGMPSVFVMRSDFPHVPHLVMKDLEFPRQLCLYERSWIEERPNWAPAQFVDRIRAWLSGTADGTLHREDQALEPVIAGTSHRLILPPLGPTPDRVCWIEHYLVSTRGDGKIVRYVAFRDDPHEGNLVHLPVLFIKGPVVTHGVIRRQPENLQQLEQMLNGMGGSIVSAIAAEFGPVLSTLKAPAFAREALVMVVQLPKRRADGGPEEIIEYQGFVFVPKIGELLQEDTEQVQKNGIWVPESRARLCNPAKLGGVAILPISVGWHLEPTFAALMNGYEEMKGKVIAVGVGALGSQVTNNLVRGGFGEWTLVDDDLFEPHNAARHLVPSHGVGYPKVTIVSEFMRGLHQGKGPPVAIPCDFFQPGEHEQRLNSALRDADLVLDFSASVGVGRKLATDGRTQARRMSVFLNQRGDELVVLAEDRARTTNLIWLEAEYIKAVGFDSRLRGHFDGSSPSKLRYGNGCRELSVIVAQDVIALHAGLASQTIRRFSKNPAAGVTVFRLNRETGTVVPVKLGVTKPITFNVEEWTVQIHPSVAKSAFSLRKNHLPAETGGVLLGLVDRESQFVAIVGLLPAPSDSIQWPTSFIRGSNGLRAAVEGINKRTQGNLLYVGEWHSHPMGHDARPSTLDLAAIGMCSPYMEADGLPTLMMIVGHDNDLVLAAKPLGLDHVDALAAA
jgi:integrative and conjugative element protein (TIGR02256 family)